MNGMTKKITAILLFLILIIQCLPLCVSAADETIRQADVVLPEVSVEISGDYSRKDIDSITLDDENLKIKDVVSADTAGSKLVYILVDISTSMSQSALNALKPTLIDYVLSLEDDDKFIMKTFGTEVTTVLDGDESDDEIEYTINNLYCNSDGTTFYEALNQTLKDSQKETDFARKFSIVISDGADFEKGNSSQQEVVDNFETNRLPIYGLCVSDTSKENADGFGYISRISGGELVSFSSYDASTKFYELTDISNDVTIIKAKSSVRKSLGKVTMILSVDGKTYEQEVFGRGKKDTVFPEVEEIDYDKDADCITITFSESVDNANKASSFKITKGKKEYPINDVDYSGNVAKIYTEKKFYSGKYDFEFIDIVDATDNKNPLKDDSITARVSANSIILTILVILLIILIPVGFLVALYLILLNLKKKKNVEKIKDVFVAQVEEKEVEQIHIEEPKGKRIKIFIDCSNGQNHRFEYNLVSSAIIGRDSICDICIEDNRMSQQHFALEIVENGLAVTDLQSTNGTFVNGVQIYSKTFLPIGSKILAGNSIITIDY